MAAAQLQPEIDLKGIRRKLISFTGIGCVPCLCPFLSQPQCSLSVLVALLVLLSEDMYQLYLVLLGMTLTAPLCWPQSCSTMWPCSSITCGRRKCCLRGESSCCLLLLARHFGQLALSLSDIKGSICCTSQNGASISGTEKATILLWRPGFSELICQFVYM